MEHNDLLWSAIKEAGGMLMLPDAQAYVHVQMAYEQAFGKPADNEVVKLSFYGIPVRFLSAPAQEVLAMFEEARFEQGWRLSKPGSPGS